MKFKPPDIPKDRKDLELLSKEALAELVWEQQCLIEKLIEEVERLKGICNKDSKTSSLPPSSDQRSEKTPVTKEKESDSSHRKPGGELGHPEKTRKSPNLIAKLLKSLMAEISLRWLLFLGLFMVVISSGLLAASQWEKFPPTGQYLVLLAYTLCFWGATFWTRKVGGLRLTSETLRLVTLLLVPVNFWAIDGLGLWRNIGELLIVAIASFLLTSIIIYFDKKFNNSVSTNWISITSLNLLSLSYLHYGWRFSGFPILAIYLGVIGTAIATIYHNQTPPITKTIEIENQTTTGDPLTGIAMVIYALGILLVRAIFVANVDITKLGLALGISGWILLRNNQIQRKLFVQNRIGISLLLIGWLVSVNAQPWQAFIISIIGLFLLAENLQKSWQSIDISVIFLIGLQTTWLGWRLIPVAVRQTLITTTTQIFNAQNSPESLLSLAWFPYLIFMVWATDWIYRRQQINLAKFSEKICLGFGVFLNILSWQNPLVIFLNFLGSTITLAIFTSRRQPIKVSLVYLTHITGLLSIFSGINYFLPSISLEMWAIICSVIMLAEWGIFSLETKITAETRIVTPTSSISLLSCFCLSSWHLGLVLAVISYILWLSKLEIFPSDLCMVMNCKLSAKWGIIWFITPLALTIIASKRYPPLPPFERGGEEGRKKEQSGKKSMGNQTPINGTQSVDGGVLNLKENNKIISFRQRASGLSVAAVIMLQILTLWQPETRLIGLGLGTTLMLINTKYLLTQTAANITVGFVLIFVSFCLGEGVLGLSPVSGAGWLLTISIFLVILWFLYSRIIRLPGQLFNIYTQAIDGWAITLCSLELIFLTIHSFGIYWQIINPSITVIISTILILFAIGYRGSIKQTAENSSITFSLHNFVQSTATVYSFGWALELLIVETLGFVDKSTINLAIANIGLGLSTQILGDWLQRKTGINNLPRCWQVMPLLYGILGALFRVGTFESWTGLTSLALSFILIGIGRRKSTLKPILYLGIIGISCAAAELLLYQIYSLPLADKLIAYASLGTTITYSYRLLSPWLLDYLKITETEIKNIANIHWAVSSSILLLLIISNFKSNPILGLTTAILLTRYAIMQGKNNSNLQQAETWIYVGVLEGYAVAIYIINLLSITEILLYWLSAITAIISYFIYLLPWENWGWPLQPWRRIAVIMPIVTIFLTNLRLDTAPPWYWYASTLITAGFYIVIAKVDRQIRLTYISVGLINCAFIIWLNNLEASLQTLTYITPIGLSLLYIAKVDPILELSKNKNLRHNLRLFGSGIICFIALLENQWTGLLPGIISIIAIFAGLGLRTRAFLYIGTVTFLINAFNQLIVLNSLYSFFKWIIGLIVGIVFIWIAANFETRREQINNLLPNWIEKLEEWE
ncbi:MAG: DUF2157 domain-containing protein [Okeania sp. SIO3B5]|uniref:DUF6444 domain-containing protein n=1 Tax=Okeania sp. SIO3B5 TaxID=2607811 RepID=UPI0014002F0D|nr:DUF6444 domain-containing protein [Okeania sp. SIO3B5]NEO54464.1 DUF2157 domain-containing protein [Okeania sp. SIO3B5]